MSDFAVHSKGTAHRLGYVSFEDVMNKAFSDVRNGIDANYAL